MVNVGNKIKNFFTKDVKGGFEAIPNAIKDGFNEVKDTFENIGDDIKGGFNQVKDTFEDLGDDIKGEFQGLGKNIVGGFNQVKNTFEDLGDNIKGEFQGLGRNILGGLNQVKDTFEDLGDDIKDEFTGLGKNILGGLKDVGKEISGPFVKFGLDTKETFESIGELLNEVGDVTDSAFGYVAETGKFLGDLTIGSVEFVVDVLKQIVKMFPALVRILKSAFQMLEKGYEITTVILLIAPALVIFMYTVILIEILDNNAKKE